MLEELSDHRREARDIKPVLPDRNTVDYVMRRGPAPVLKISPPAGVQNEPAFLGASMDFNANRVGLPDGESIGGPGRNKNRRPCPSKSADRRRGPGDL